MVVAYSDSSSNPSINRASAWIRLAPSQIMTATNLPFKGNSARSPKNRLVVMPPPIKIQAVPKSNMRTSRALAKLSALNRHLGHNRMTNQRSRHRIAVSRNRARYTITPARPVRATSGISNDMINSAAQDSNNHQTLAPRRLLGGRIFLPPVFIGGSP